MFEKQRKLLSYRINPINEMYIFFHPSILKTYFNFIVYNDFLLSKINKFMIYNITYSEALKILIFWKCETQKLFHR